MSSLLLEDSRIDISKGDNDGITGFMLACHHGDSETVSLLSESSRVKSVCGWKESVDILCRRVSENVMRDEDKDEDEEGSLYSVWNTLNGIGMGVFIRGWFGENERMKEVWIYGDRERREKHKRSSEMVSQREIEWRRVSDYILEEDITSVLILFHAEMIQMELNTELLYDQDDRRRILEMESM